MTTTRYAEVTVLLKKKYPSPPKIKVTKPRNTKVIRVDNDKFIVNLLINTKAFSTVTVRYTIDNFTTEESNIRIQCCPGCREPLPKWLEIPVIAHDKSLVYLSFCPLCGNAFLSAAYLNKILHPEQGRRILLPGEATH